MTSNINIKYFWYLFLCFYIFYTPEFLLVLGIPIRSQYVVLVVNFLIINKLIIRKIFEKNIYINWNRNLTVFFIGVFTSSIYFSLVAALNNQHIRIIQNTYILFQIFPLIYYLSKLDLLKKTRIQKIHFFYNILLINGISVLTMILIPNLKAIALSLYYLGRNENIFISSMRIYGISGEYTFFTPIFHGVALGTAVYLILFENQKKFILYIPFLFLSILLNGRTGLLISFILILLQFIFFIFTKINKIFNLLIVGILILVLSTVIIELLKEYSPSTYLWINEFFSDVIIFYREGEKQGTLDILSKMVVFPTGVGLIFGKGFRLYGNNLGYIHSDIGYVNDLFMGGIIYCAILYFNIIYYICSFKNTIIPLKNQFLLSTMFISALMIANYKGEAMRGGLIVLGIVILKYLLSQEDKVLT